MPPLYEGSQLYMPTSPPGLAITEATRLLQVQDKMLRTFPEVETVFGTVGGGTNADPVEQWRRFGHHEADRRSDRRRNGDVDDSRADYHARDLLHHEAACAASRSTTSLGNEGVAVGTCVATLKRVVRRPLKNDWSLRKLDWEPRRSQELRYSTARQAPSDCGIHRLPSPSSHSPSGSLGLDSIPNRSTCPSGSATWHSRDPHG